MTNYKSSHRFIKRPRCRVDSHNVFFQTLSERKPLLANRALSSILVSTHGSRRYINCLNTTNYKSCHIVSCRVDSHNVRFQTLSKRKPLLAYLAHVSRDAGVRGDMIVIVGANRESLPTMLALVSVQLLVYVFNVFHHHLSTDECTLTLCTHNMLAAVSSFSAIHVTVTSPNRLTISTVECDVSRYVLATRYCDTQNILSFYSVTFSAAVSESG